MLLKNNSPLTSSFLDQSEDPIWMIDLDFQLIYANKSYLNIVKEVTGKEQRLNESAFLEDFDEGYTKKWKSYYERALGGEKFEIEEHVSNPETNDIKYGQITFNPIIGEDQKVFAIACQSRDISNIIKNRSEANQLIDASLDVFCTINEQGKFVSVSAASLILWGFSPAELIGKDYQDFILEEDLPKTIKIASAIFNGQDVKSFTNRYIRKDGGIAYNLWSVKWDPRTKLTYCVARDAQEIIEKEEKILHSEQRFRALVQEGSDMIAIFDPKGNYLYASPSSNSILGIPQEEFIGRNVFDFIHPKDSERVLESLHKIVTENRVTLKPFRFQNHKKEWRWLETVLTNMLDNSAVNGIVANSRDVTEEKKLRRLNQQTNLLSKIGSWEVDLLNKTVFWTNEVHHLHDTDPSTFTPTFDGAINFYREDFREIVKSNVERCISTGEPYFLEAVIVTAKNRELWVRSNATAEFTNGVCTRIFGSIQNVHERKIAELDLLKAIEKVEASDAKFKAYTQQSPIAIYTTNIQGDCIYANETWLNMTGMQLEEVLGKGWIKALHPDDLEHVTHNWNKSIKENGNWIYEYRFIDKKGKIIWVNGTAKKLYNKKNEHYGYLGTNINITERKKAEQDKFNLQKTLENSLNEIYIFDAETLQFSYINKGALFNLGYSEKEIKKLTPIDLKPEFTETSFKQIVKPLLNNEKRKIIFFTNHQRKDGSCYPVEVHLQLVAEGNNRRYIAIILDITDRKKAEEENRFKANLLSTIGQAAIATNLDGVVTYWNKAAEDIYGWKQKDAIGKNIIHLTPVETNKEQALQIMEVLKKGQTWSGEFEVQKKDGTIFPVSISNSPTYDENNQLSGIIGISSDITQKVKYEKLLKQHSQELERSNAALKKIAWTQSHVVRAPLSRILAVINLIEEQPDSIEEISFWMNQLKISTNEMDDIVKKIISETNHLDQELI